MNQMTECPNGDCLNPFQISDTTINITIRTSSRPPSRSLATTNYAELDCHDGMTIRCIYETALLELAQGENWRPDGLCRIEVSINGQEWNTRTTADLNQPLPIREILALRDAQNALAIARRDRTGGMCPPAAVDTGIPAPLTGHALVLVWVKEVDEEEAQRYKKEERRRQNPFLNN